MADYKTDHHIINKLKKEYIMQHQNAFGSIVRLFKINRNHICVGAWILYQPSVMPD